MDKPLIVGIADMKITKAPGTLITYALGSCVGVCIYDPVLKLAGMVHVMLPINLEPDKGHAFKYADTGIAATIKRLEAFGCVRSRMISKIAGGAKMFDIPGGSLGSIGMRNVECVRLVLKKERIRLVREDIGLKHARTLSFDANTGMGKIKSYGRDEVIL